MLNLIKKFFLRTENLNANGNLKDKFSKIYSHNIFGGKESRSGEGSNMEQTAEIRRRIPEVIKKYNIESMLDAPCGDFFWMKETSLGLKKYIGADIVDTLIQKNIKQFGNETTEFVCLNLVEDQLPKVDLIICRDCLVHLTFEHAKKMISNFKKSGAKYLLTTSFNQRDLNADLVGKDIWRPLNLQIAPFDFPEPLEVIDEKCTEYHGKFADKQLVLWLLNDVY
jgi:hypothetical protein